MAASKPLGVPVAGGIRQDLSEHVAPPGTLMDAVNVRFSTADEVEARPGTTALSAATSADVTLAEIWDGTGILDSSPGGFVVGSEGFGYRYDFAAARLFTGGSYGNAAPISIFDTMAREQATAGSYLPAPLSQAAANGYVATIYSCGNGQDGFGPGDTVAILHVFTEDGTLVATATYTASKAWLVKDGSGSTNMVLITQDATTGLSASVIATSATGATVGAATSVGTLSNNTYHWAAAHQPGVGWLLAYQSAVGTITVKTLTSTTTTNTTTIAIAAAISPLSIYGDGANVYLGFRDGAGTPYTAYGVVYTNALGAVTGAVSIYVENVGPYIGPPLFGPSLSAATVTFVVSRTDGAIDDQSWITVGELTAAGAASSLYTTYQCTALSAPFGPGYVWVHAGGFNNDTSSQFERPLLLDYMALRTTSGTAANRYLWGPVVALTRELFIGAPSLTYYPATIYKQSLSAPVQLSDGSYLQGLPRIVRMGPSTTGLALAEWVRFSLGGVRQTTRYGESVAVSGFPTYTSSESGTLQYVLGTSYATQDRGLDAGLPLPPAIASITLSNSSGLLTSGGTYSWRAVLERIDSSGRRWRSAPSDVTTKTLGGADDSAAVSLQVGTDWLRATSKLTDDNASTFVVHVYRTTAGGSTFYRVTPDQGAPTPATNGGATFNDYMADTVASAREILYTDGGVLPNDCPPSCRFVRATEDRIWLAGLWEPEQLQSSKIIVPGEPPQFSDSPAFRVALPEPCTGIAYQDGTVIAFTRTAIYAIQGAGPNDQGQGAWDSPRCVTRSSGCVNELAIVETSIGIFYQSIRGIELLPRGLGEPVFIGMQVQSTLGSLLVQSSSVVSTGKDRTVRFCYGAAGVGSVSVLVYDLDTQCWSRDSYPLSISGICDTEEGAVLATVDPDADAGYGFLLEGDGQATDQSNTNAYEIPSSLEWARVRPFGVCGMGKFSGAVALFDAETPGYRSGNATLSLVVDDQSEPGFTFNMSSLSGASYRRVVPKYDAGTAGKLTLTTTVGGWRFIGWTVELEEIGGTRRMTETEQG